jgi:hypothetical protein
LKVEVAVKGLREHLVRSYQGVEGPVTDKEAQGQIYAGGFRGFKGELSKG